MEMRQDFPYVSHILNYLPRHYLIPPSKEQTSCETVIMALFSGDSLYNMSRLWSSIGKFPLNFKKKKKKKSWYGLERFNPLK